MIGKFDQLTCSTQAFYGCTSLTHIEIPDGVTEIGSKGFYGCSSLSTIQLNCNITEIKQETFSGCTSLTSIEIPNNVSYIGSLAFNGRVSLKNITISSNVTISSDAFSGCTSLDKITYLGLTDPIGQICQSLKGCSIIKVEVPSNYEGEYFCGRKVNEYSNDDFRYTNYRIATVFKFMYAILLKV